MGRLGDLARGFFRKQELVLLGGGPMRRPPGPADAGAGPAPPREGCVQIRSGEHLAYDEPELRLGDVWTHPLELLRHEDATPDDWYPFVDPADDGATPALTLVEGSERPATYRFVGDVVAADPAMHYAVIDTGVVSIAVAGQHVGRVQGIGILNYDDGMMFRSDTLDPAQRRPLVVSRIQAVRMTMERTGPHSWAATGFTDPVDVATTIKAARAVEPHSGVFFIDLRPA